MGAKNRYKNVNKAPIWRGVFTCSEIKDSFAGAGFWRYGCEQNVNAEKKFVFRDRF